MPTRYGIALKRNVTDETFRSSVSGLPGLAESDIDADVSRGRIRVVELPDGADEEAFLSGVAALDHLVLHVGPVLATRGRTASILSPQLIVSFATSDMGRIRAALRRHKVWPVRRIAYVPNGFLVRVGRPDPATGPSGHPPVRPPRKAGKKVRDRIHAMEQDPDVDWVEPNAVAHVQQHSVTLPPTDPIYAEQWHLKDSQIKARAAWEALSTLGVDATYGSPDITIGVIDFGIPGTLQDFSGEVTSGLPKVIAIEDFETGDTGNYGEDHGVPATAVATAMVNEAGSVGVAPNCRLISIGISELSTDLTLADALYWTAGLEPAPATGIPVYAGPGTGLGEYEALVEDDLNVELPPLPLPGADVLSCSWSRDAPRALALRSVLLDLYQDGRSGKGTVVVFAGGDPNYSTDWPTPNDRYDLAAYWTTISAAACTEAGGVDTNSVSANYHDLCAPAGLWTIGPDGNKSPAPFDDTSAATPQIAGAAALVLSVNPELSAGDVAKILRQSANSDAVTGGTAQNFGHGRLDVHAAIDLAAGSIEGGGAWTVGAVVAGEPISDHRRNEIATELASAIPSDLRYRLEHDLRVTHDGKHVELIAILGNQSTKSTGPGTMSFWAGSSRQVGPTVAIPAMEPGRVLVIRRWLPLDVREMSDLKALAASDTEADAVVISQDRRSRAMARVILDL